MFHQLTRSILSSIIIYPALSYPVYLSNLLAFLKIHFSRLSINRSQFHLAIHFSIHEISLTKYAFRPSLPPPSLKHSFDKCTLVNFAIFEENFARVQPALFEIPYHGTPIVTDSHATAL